MSLGGTDNYTDLPIGTTLHGKFDDCCPDDFDWVEDEDWYRVLLQADKTYRFSALADSGSIVLTMKHESGNDVFEASLDSRSGQLNVSTVHFTPQKSGYFFAMLTDPADESTSRYTVSANLVEDFPSNPSTPATLFMDGYKLSEISHLRDNDWYRVRNLSAGWSYEFELRGAETNDGTLSNPILRFYDSHSKLLTYNNNATKQNLNSRITFKAPESGDYFISAAGVGNSTGSYRVTATIVDDFATGSTTKGMFPAPSHQFSVRPGIIEKSGDIDWIKVELEQGQWYRFNLVGKDPSPWKQRALLLRDPQQRLVGRDSGRSNPVVYYQAKQSGTHYFISRGATGEYYASVTKHASPILKSNLPSFSIPPELELSLDEVLPSLDFDFDLVQVLANVDLNRGNSTLARNTLHFIRPSEIRETVLASTAEGGDHDFNFRVRTKGNNGSISWTGWASTQLLKHVDYSRHLESDHRWTSQNTTRGNGEITIGFPEMAPDYYQDGELEQFSPVPAWLRTDIQTFIRRIQQVIPNVRLANHEASENADINIFLGEHDRIVKANSPGRESGGDILLRKNFYQYQHFYRLGENYRWYSIVRGLGAALGLNPSANLLSTDDSVMGSNTGTTGNAFPGNFGVADIQQLQSLYGVASTEPGKGWNLSLSGEKPLYSTIYDDQPIRVPIQNKSNRGSTIDLRPGQLSFLHAEKLASHMFRLAPQTHVFDAWGGPTSDNLIGNAHNNRLIGNDGNDFLSGRQGDDRLQGGFGDDVYEFKTGWGVDRIEDAFKNDAREGERGIDTLRIFANFSNAELEKDLSFRRHGDNLHIDLDLNGQYNRGNGSVIVEGMANSQQRVERLELWVADRHLATYSMASIWEHSNHLKQRFTPTDRRDAFGLTVIPTG